MENANKKLKVYKAGYQCPILVTPQEFLDRKEEFGYGN